MSQKQKQKWGVWVVRQVKAPAPKPDDPSSAPDPPPREEEEKQ